MVETAKIDGAKYLNAKFSNFMAILKKGILSIKLVSSVLYSE